MCEINYFPHVALVMLRWSYHPKQSARYCHYVFLYTDMYHVKVGHAKLVHRL